MRDSLPPKMKFPDTESELLIRCCAVSGPLADTSTMRALLERGVDGQRFLALANRNSVTPMVAARLGVAGAGGMAPPFARALALSYEVNALRSHHRAGYLVEIVEALAAGGVPAIALKGPALALAAYGDVAMRVFGDLDFLVRREDLPRAAKALEGLRYSSPAYRPGVVESGFFPDVSLDFSREDSVVDLHWRLSPRYFPYGPGAEQVWQRTAEIELLGRRVRILGQEDSILFQACHGTKHGWRTLAQICDFARLLAGAGAVDWTGLLEDARQTRSLRMLLLGAALADSMQLAEVAAEVLAAARADSQVAALSRRIAARIFDAKRTVELDEWSVALRSIGSMRERVSYLVERVARPKLSDRTLMPLPRALYPLYYVARPFLAAYKHRERLFGTRKDIQSVTDPGI